MQSSTDIENPVEESKEFVHHHRLMMEKLHDRFASAEKSASPKGLKVKIYRKPESIPSPRHRRSSNLYCSAAIEHIVAPKRRYQSWKGSAVNLNDSVIITNEYLLLYHRK